MLLKIDFTVPASGYLCVCGQSFEHPMERTMHGAGCEVWRDHCIGTALLKELPRDKYGGYMIVAPGILIMQMRQIIKEEQEKENGNTETQRTETDPG